MFKYLTWLVLTVLAAAGHVVAGDAPAPETDLAALRARLHHHDHNWMMLATVEALSAADRRYLEPELELLITRYTTFPDENWANQGEWGGWSGFPDAGRTANDRREWGVSHACGFSPVSGQGRPLSLHAPPGSYQAARVLFPRIVSLLKEGKHGDAMRVFGAMSHAIQDSATFPHMQALHRSADFRFDQFGIPGYQPVELGDTPDAAAEALARRVEEMVHFTEKVALDIRKALAAGDAEKNGDLRTRCANEAAKVVADAAHTAIRLAGPKPQRKEPPPGLNLIVNPSAEQADFGEPWPVGWVAHWNDPMDRLGRITWSGLIPRNQNLWHSGRHSLKLMWAGSAGLQWRQTWPAAVWVKPGQRYRATAWVKTVQASGHATLALQLATRAAKTVATAESESIAGDRDWTQLAVETDVPAGAERLRVVLASRANEGAAWFDDVALVRVDNATKVHAEKPSAQAPVAKAPVAEAPVAEAPVAKAPVAKAPVAKAPVAKAPVAKAPVAKAPVAEDLMLWLSFNEGKGMHPADRSPYSGINGPNLMASGGIPADLYVADGVRSAAVRLDGTDDFVECPVSGVQDVLCPTKAMTLSLWLHADQYRNAVLVSKLQQYAGKPPRGYALRLGDDGRIRFTVHTDRGAATAESADPLPLGRWTHVAATRSPDGRLIVYVDARAGKPRKFAGKFLPPVAGKASFYLGADTGVRDFFAGRIDEVRLFNRALGADEIARLKSPD